MSTLNCNIEVENRRAVYQPGDVLSGRVLVTLNERILIKALALRMSGYAFVRWEQPLPPKKQKKTCKQKKQMKNQKGDCVESTASFVQAVEVYGNREDFMSTTNFFMGSEDATPKIVESGTFSYPFTISLPSNCPSSFESAIGHICYTIEVFVDYTNGRTTCALINLPLIKPYDLRADASLLQPRDVTAEEKRCFARFWLHPLQLHVNVPRAGYVPGEKISVHVIIQNEDQLSLSELTYKLNLVVTYVGIHGKRKPKTKVVRMTLDKCIHPLRGITDSTAQHLHTMRMPQTSATTQPSDCNCLRVGYEVEVCLSTANVKREVCAQLPIVVGTVSLHSLDAKQLPHCEQDTSRPALMSNNSVGELRVQQIDDVGMMSSFNIATAPVPETPTDMSASHLNLASSFREAEFMPNANLNENTKRSKSIEQLDFRPKYLYFDMSEPVQHMEVSSTSSHSNAQNEQLRAQRASEKEAEALGLN